MQELMDNSTQEYQYYSAEPTYGSAYLWPALQKILRRELAQGAEIFELGCGSGAGANMLQQCGYKLTAIDPSVSGIEAARAAYPQIRFEQRSAYDDLAAEFGVFDAVASLEVVEHCYWPRQYADTVLNLLKPGGVALISTPFHGYWKNLAIALSGKSDQHYTALWDGGHIKFWSEATLRELLMERGFQSVDFVRVGRIPLLAKSMIAIARKAT